MVSGSWANLKDEWDTGATMNLLEYLFLKPLLINILKFNSNTMGIYVQLYQCTHYTYTLK